MFWYPWSENIKKRACRYLLQRYLGNFLEEKLTLDQLSVDLYNGTGTVSEVSLDCEALNELGDAQNWPLEIVNGQMREITVTVPWSTLLKDDSIVEIDGLCVTVQPKVRAEPVSSMLESMWSSMSSSMQLAAECLREEADPQESSPVEGIEMFAHAIDSILSRVKVKFINTKIRIEHVPKNSDRGIALEIHIKNTAYFDEAGSEPQPETTETEKSKTYVVSTYTNKKIKFSGVTFYMDEFPSKLRTMAPSLIMEKSASSQARSDATSVETPDANCQSTMSDVFYEARSVASTIDSDLIKDIIEERASEATRETTPEDRCIQPEPVLFAKLTGHHELSFKLKNSEEVDGPKVEVQVLLGSLLVFITPRQLHTMFELVDALNQPHLEDTSNIPLRPNAVNVQCKPMKPADFQLIEAQLLGNLENHTKSNQMRGWSGPGIEDSDSEKFHPMTSENQLSESFSSSVSSMSTSMSSSINLPTAQPRIKRNRKVPHIDGDPTAEVSHVSFRIMSVSCVLLHKDIIVPTPMSITCISPTSAIKLHQISSEFFARIETFGKIEERRDLMSINDALDKATDLNHLRVLASEISLDGSEKVTSHGSQTLCEAGVRAALVRECLYTHTGEDLPVLRSYDIVRFDTEDDEPGIASMKSNLRINFKQTAKYMRVGGEKKLVYPTTDVVVKCTPFHVDVDLTLIERMSATFFNGNSKTSPQNQSPSQPQNHCSFTLHCPNMNVVLRFPIADLRVGVNHELRRVRSDYLVFKLTNVTAGCVQAPSVRPLPTTVTLKATFLDLYYHENENSPAIHVAQSTMDDTTFETDMLKGNVITPLPVISLTFKARDSNKGPFDSLADEMMFNPKSNNPMTTSMYIMNNLKSSQPSPFSGKKMAHQSTSKHENKSQGQEEELIVPGTDEEMKEFTNSSVEHSLIHLDFNLPILSLQLESKQLYEILYNRINSDLLLWEPQIVEPFDITPHICGPIYPAFGAWKGFDSDTESTSSEEENLYYSTYDHKARKNTASKAQVEQQQSDAHNFCLTLNIGKGLLTIYAPVRDSNKQVVPGQMGELVLEAHKVTMCQVSGLNAVPKSAQMALRAARTTLYHQPLITIPAEKPPLRQYGTTLPVHLKKTIYPSNKGVFIKEHLEPKDMFIMALKTEPNSDTPNFKTICIALGIEQATLRHRGDTGIAWLTQLMDVLDVLDYPVPGYTPSVVLSELHVHVWDCAVDYRPLYLPIWSVVTLGNFSVSSNLIPETNTSYLRFLAQECTLLLRHVHAKNAGAPAEDKQPDIHRDYVCVLDLGLFELSLRMTDKNNGSDQPQVDLSASNNMINVYTCWDSASALCRLVTYIACDGDSHQPYDRSRHTSICSDQPIEQLVGLDERQMEEIRELSPSEIQQVNDLMAEALKESPNNTNEEDELQSSTEKEGVEVFFFPDESNSKKSISEIIDAELEPQSIDEEYKSIDNIELAQEAKPNAHVAKDLGDLTSTPKASPRKGKRKNVKSSSEGNNTDDEYCIVDTQPGGEDNEMDEPVVNWIGPGPCYMLDNHFSMPPARSDVLKAPRNFPQPVLRYTLCEMSLTWNMYGGNDFRATSDTPKKTVTIDGDGRKQNSPTTAKRTSSKDYEPYEKSRALATAYTQGVRWRTGSERVRAAPQPAHKDIRTRGGRHRDHRTRVTACLTKVKFQYEVYPNGGTHASRQTLAIAKIEVLDRLLCSDINKLLSQFKLKDEPERKNAHMLVVKAVHLRTESALPSQECCLKVSLLPLRFNLDQDTLAFLIGFFSKLGTDETVDDDTKSVGGLSTESSGSRQTTPTHRPPVMSIATHLKDPPPTPTSLGDGDCLSLNDTNVMRDDTEEPLMETYEAERLVSENLIQLEEDFQRLAINQEKPQHKPLDSEPVDDSPIYFRRVVFSPEVPIRLDYVGKRVDLSAGPVAGLLMGLGQLNCSELTLKRLDYKLGLLGLEKLVQWALHEWLSDIKRHQLPGLLSGIGPMHSLLQIITGIRDLVWLPVEQWRRDGRLVHGLRRGAASFTARTAVAALDITARILHLIQATAETALDMLTPTPALTSREGYERRERRRRRRRDSSRQPADIREGVASAYNTVREGIAEQATSLGVAARRGRGTGVLRQIPGAAVAPLALAAAGAAQILGGVRAALAPHSRRDHCDKWRPPPDSTD
ncbi:autophagy-related protein 2 homolog A isoform X2 [Leptidea sinapis]|uniref:autophagy-related protein 2 homolog A isoform X2 n=1 Tax=Leptidea sinapis TaxID=189913 RepID=UPI0021C475AF|nr:autophagy-related protein 2 homolog A isoform X2 [Leptidea sinapis]